MSISNRPPRLELVTAVRNRCASAPVCRVYIYGSGKVRRERLPDCESQRPRATSGCRDRHSTIVVDCQIPTDKREIPFSQIPSRFTPHAFVYSINNRPSTTRPPVSLLSRAASPLPTPRAARAIYLLYARILHAPRTACGCAGARLINVAFRMCFRSVIPYTHAVKR